MRSQDYESQIVERVHERRYRPMERYIVGLDLGKNTDPTAIAVSELHPFNDVTLERTKFQPALGEARNVFRYHHRIVNLHRYMLGTPYVEIVASVGRILAQLPAAPYAPELVVDRTGVGEPVVEMFKIAGLEPISVGITAGSVVKTESRVRVNVPKAVLASTLDAALGADRLDITTEAKASDVLRLELQNFHAKVRASGTTAYEAHREGLHDDLVLALALAVWRGEHQKPVWVPVDDWHGIYDTKPLRWHRIR